MHSNKNLIPSVLGGIAAGEEASKLPNAAELLAAQVALLAQLDEPPPVGGYRLGNLVKAKAIAKAQGFVAAVTL